MHHTVEGISTEKSGEILEVAVSPLVLCYKQSTNDVVRLVLCSNRGLTVPKEERRRPRGDETSLEIPLDFPKIPRLANNSTCQQLVEFFFTRRHFVAQTRF